MKSRLKVVCLCGAIVVGIVAAGGASAAKPKLAKPKPAQSEPVAAKPANPPSAAPAEPLNGIAQSFGKAGVSDCLSRVNQVTNFLIGSGPAGAVPFLPPSSVNRRIISTSMEVTQQNGVPTYASATFAPIGGQGCSVSYDAVAYWSNTCNDVATKVFGNMQSAGVLKQGVAILVAGANVRVFLMPAGQGCISIKKELLY